MVFCVSLLRLLGLEAGETPIIWPQGGCAITWVVVWVFTSAQAHVFPPLRQLLCSFLSSRLSDSDVFPHLVRQAICCAVTVLFPYELPFLPLPQTVDLQWMHRKKNRESFSKTLKHLKILTCWSLILALDKHTRIYLFTEGMFFINNLQSH